MPTVWPRLSIPNSFVTVSVRAIPPTSCGYFTFKALYNEGCKNIGTLPLQFCFKVVSLGCSLWTNTTPGKALSADVIVRQTPTARLLGSRMKVVTKGASRKFSGLLIALPSTESSFQSGAQALFWLGPRYLSTCSGSTLQMFSGNNSRFRPRGWFGFFFFSGVEDGVASSGSIRGSFSSGSVRGSVVGSSGCV